MVTFEKRAADLISLYILFLHYRPCADTQGKYPWELHMICISKLKLTSLTYLFLVKDWIKSYCIRYHVLQANTYGTKPTHCFSGFTFVIRSRNEINSARIFFYIWDVFFFLRDNDRM